jgi:transcriptional regulator NrdR family protein
MKCSKCNEGELRAYQTRYNQTYSGTTRKRVCDKCGYTARTIEVRLDTYGKDITLANGLIALIDKYNAEVEATKNV